MIPTPKDRGSEAAASHTGKPSNIQSKLLLLLLAVLVPVLLVQTGVYYNRFQTQCDYEIQHNLEVARAVKETFNEFIRDILREELTIGITFTLPSPPTIQQMQQILDANKKEYPPVLDMSWVSPEGHIVVSSRDNDFDADITGSPYLMEILSGKEWTISNLQESGRAGEPIFAVSRGIRDTKGSLLGVVVTTVSPRHLDYLMAVDRATGSGIVLMDGEGKLVYRHPETDDDHWTWEERSMLRDHPAIKDVLRGKEVTVTLPGIVDHQPRFVAFTQLRSTGWIMAACRKAEEVTSPLASSLLHDTGLLFFVGLLSLGIALFISRTIAHPIRQLQKHALALGGGALHRRVEVSGPCEVRDLANAFNCMTEEIRLREETLRKMNEELDIRVQRRTAELEKAGEILARERQRLFSLLDRLPAFVFLMGPDHIIRFANQRFLTHFGETKGRFCYEILQGRQEPCFQCRSAEILSSGLPHEWEWTHPATNRTYQLYGYPFTDVDGSPLVLELGIDITDRKYAEENLRVYTAKLEQSNQELQDFAFVASHDLQEPLRKIQAFSERLVARYSDVLGDHGRDHLARMQNATVRMQVLIQSLLSYSRLSTKVEPFKVVALSDVLQEIVVDLEIRIEQTGSRVEIEELPQLEADPTQMRQLFQNLLSNALKFLRDEKPIIKIHGEYFQIEGKPPDEEWCRIYVEDNGIGFDDRDSDRIFGLFHRLHGRSAYEGTGIGLAICRKIVERHGGSITAKGKPGVGATFIITLPLRQSIREE